LVQHCTDQRQYRLILACPDSGWSIRLPVSINEKQLGVVLTRSVSAGEVLQAGDVKLVDVANPAMARNVITSPDLAIGQSMRSGRRLEAGCVTSWCMRHMVRAGQPVKVEAGGDGFACCPKALPMAMLRLAMPCRCG
jgi:flagella basal body P-ring formation protein FlgA